MRLHPEYNSPSSALNICHQWSVFFVVLDGFCTCFSSGFCLWVISLVFQLLIMISTCSLFHWLVWVMLFKPWVCLVRCPFSSLLSWLFCLKINTAVLKFSSLFNSVFNQRMRFRTSAWLCHSYGDIWVYCLNLSQCRKQRGKVHGSWCSRYKQTKPKNIIKLRTWEYRRKIDVTVLHANQRLDYEH